MATKKAKASAKRGRTMTPVRKAAARSASRKTANVEPGIKDPVGRFMHDHWGALGKDYKLEYLMAHECRSRGSDPASQAGAAAANSTISETD